MITVKTPFFLIYVKRIHKDVTEKLIHHENEIIVKNKLIFYILWGGRNFLKGHLTIWVKKNILKPPMRFIRLHFVLMSFFKKVFQFTSLTVLSLLYFSKLLDNITNNTFLWCYKYHSLHEESRRGFKFIAYLRHASICTRKAKKPYKIFTEKRIKYF